MIGVERPIYSASGTAEPPVISQKIRSFCSFSIDHRPLRLLESGNEQLSPLLALPASCSQGWKRFGRRGSGALPRASEGVHPRPSFPSEEQPVCLACTRTHCTSQNTICPPFCAVDLPFMRVDYVHRRTVAVFDVSQNWESLKCWMLSGLVVSQKAAYHRGGLISLSWFLEWHMVSLYKPLCMVITVYRHLKGFFVLVSSIKNRKPYLIQTCPPPFFFMF